MAIYKEYTITIDTMQDLKQTETVIFNQKDYNTAKLKIFIMHDGELFDLTGSTVRLALLKSDKTKVFQDCTIKDALVGEVEAILSSQSLAVPGVVRAELTIDLPGDSTIVTTQFMINVKGSLMSDDVIESTNEFPIIQKAIDAGEILEPVDLETIVANTVNVNNLKTEVETARGTEANLSAKLETFNTQLDETVT